MPATVQDMGEYFKDFEDKKAVPSWLLQTVDLLIESRGPVETEREPIRKSKSSFVLELELITYYSWNVMDSLRQGTIPSFELHSDWRFSNVLEPHIWVGFLIYMLCST